MSKSKKTPEQEEETKGKTLAAPEEDPKTAEETPKDGKPEEKPAEDPPGDKATLKKSLPGKSRRRLRIPRRTKRSRQKVNKEGI